MFGIDPIVELGIKGKEDVVVAALRAEPKYGPLFRAAFPAAPDPVTLDNVVLALASFQRTFISGRSRFDRPGQGARRPETSPASRRRMATAAGRSAHASPPCRP